MNKLLIIGAGGHGKVVSEIAQLLNLWDDIAFLDDTYAGAIINGINVIGKSLDVNIYTKQFTHCFVAIGNNKIRFMFIKKILSLGYIIPILIHPSSIISKKVSIGLGTVVIAGSIINIDSKIGKGCIINTGSIIDHDCHISDAVHISPGVRLGGTVKIGKFSWLGINSTIINNITIGSNVLVAAGSVVINNFKNDLLIAGIPAIKKREK